MLVQEPLAAAIGFALECGANEDVAFLAERLAAEVPTEDSTLLLANVLWRAGKNTLAADVLDRSPPTLPRAKYLSAKIAASIGQTSKAERMLGAGCLRADGQPCGEAAIASFGDLLKVISVDHIRR